MATASAGMPDAGWGGRFAAAAAAALLHAVVIAAVWAWQPAKLAGPPGQGEITIDLAPATETPQQPNAAATDVVAAEAPADTDVPEEAVEAAPAEESEPRAETPPPEAEQAKAAPAEARAVPAEEAPPASRPDDVVVAATPPDETVIATPLLEPAERKPVRPAQQPRQAAAPASNASDASAAQAARRAVGGHGAKADPTAVSRFVASLRTSLEQHKRYPRESGEQGTALLRFAMDRSGRVLEAAIVRSSGSAALDRAALDMVRSASPLPRIPDAIPKASLTITVPVRFVAH